LFKFKYENHKFKEVVKVDKTKEDSKEKKINKLNKRGQNIARTLEIINIDGKSAE